MPKHPSIRVRLIDKPPFPIYRLSLCVDALRAAGFKSDAWLLTSQVINSRTLAEAMTHMENMVTVL